MYRTIYEKLDAWRTSPRRKPLIIRGVRQCGKTYSLKEFGQRNYRNVAYFNFEHELELSSLFNQDLDPHRIIRELNAFYGKNIDKDTLIIFDEIQFCNHALTSLKYFYENAPEYHIVCAGSLLGIMLSKPLSFPVGKVDMITMRPMSFYEYLIARKGQKFCDSVKERTEAMPDAFLNELDRVYREYCFVGGMPEAIGVWLETNDPDSVRTVQKTIILSYEADFAKHAPSNEVQKLNRIWNSIPQQLCKENRKFIFGHAVTGARAKDLEDSLQWLIDAGLVHKVNMTERPSIPMSAYSDPSVFKLYYADIGLLSAMSRTPVSSIIVDDDRYKEFKGGMAENYVLNELLNVTDEIPYYWRSGNKAEVDFVHMIGNEIIPIEVKSKNFSRVQSLERYIDQYDPKKAFVISERNIKNGGVAFLPLSMVWNIMSFIEKDIL